MPKSKSRRKSPGPAKKQAEWSGPIIAPSRRGNLLVAGLVAAAVLAGAWFLWQGAQKGAAFGDLAAQGQAALADVVTRPGIGGHLQPGEAHDYGEPFPTTGIHDPNPLPAGFYDTPQPPTRLVHSLEHGIIVIYYENPGVEAIARLREWTALYSGPWDGVLATPATGIGSALVVTAWSRTLRLEAFDPAAVAAFIDAYRGRGPENPVR